MAISAKPSSKTGWWAFGLGIATAVAGLSILTPIPRLLGLAVGALGLRFPMGMGSVVITIALAVAAISTGIVALVKGDRAGFVIAGLVSAVIVGGFWILFAAGELIYPH